MIIQDIHVGVVQPKEKIVDERDLGTASHVWKWTGKFFIHTKKGTKVYRWDIEKNALIEITN